MWLIDRFQRFKTIVKRIMTTLILLISGWFFVFSLWAMDISVPFKSGDLIFRQGTELISQLVISVDQGSYSHVGMIVGDAPHWQVIHATPSEVEGRLNSVVIDDLSFFIDKERASQWAVYRVGATSEQRSLVTQYVVTQLNKPFSFNVNEGTYCTYLVWQAWMQAGVDFKVDFTPLSIPMMSGQYLLPNTLAQSAELELIYVGKKRDTKDQKG